MAESDSIIWAVKIRIINKTTFYYLANNVNISSLLDNFLDILSKTLFISSNKRTCTATCPLSLTVQGKSVEGHQAATYLAYNFNINSLLDNFYVIIRETNHLETWDIVANFVDNVARIKLT